MPQWLVKPANQPIVAGDPLRVEMEIGANATPAAMVPGRLVIADTADGTVKEATTKSKGLIGFLDVDPKKLEATAYAVGDQVMVVQGECFAKLTLLASENVVRGDMHACMHGQDNLGRRTLFLLGYFGMHFFTQIARLLSLVLRGAKQKSAYVKSMLS
jgi:hypothetical protein